jgi:hypothetical protein
VHWISPGLSGVGKDTLGVSPNSPRTVTADDESPGVAAGAEALAQPESAMATTPAVAMSASDERTDPRFFDGRPVRWVPPAGVGTGDESLPGFVGRLVGVLGLGV